MLDLAQIDGMNGNTQGLEHCRLVVRQTVRDGNQALRGPCHLLSQGSILGSVPRKSKRGTKIRVPLQAERACPAWHSRIYGHPRTASRTLQDHPRRLVPENERTTDLGVSDSSLIEPVQIRSTDSNARDPDDLLARSCHGIGLIVQSQIVTSVDAEDSHSPGGIGFALRDLRISSVRFIGWPRASFPSLLNTG